MSESPRTPETILRRLEWTVVRRLDGLLQGDYRTLFRGQGLDLADLREYQFHDDVRYIDWNVTARLQTPYVREYQEDREATAWFLLDLSPSVDFESVSVSKRTVLAEFTAMMARVLTGKGNRVGSILFSGGGLDRVIAARSGRRQVLHLLEAMFARPKLARAPKTDLGAVLRDAARVIRRRSVIFVVSDFISAPGWEKSLGVLASRHDVIAVRLFDPLETLLPNIGLLTFQDSETGEQLFVDTNDRGFRKRFAQAAAEQEEAIHSAFQAAGVDALELSTADDLADAVVRFIDMRKRRKGAFAGNLPPAPAPSAPLEKAS